MCEKDRFDTQKWLLEVQRDPETLGAPGTRIENVLADPWAARCIAARLEASLWRVETSRQPKANAGGDERALRCQKGAISK
jgi:hypothetical protein